MGFCVFDEELMCGLHFLFVISLLRGFKVLILIVKLLIQLETVGYNLSWKTCQKCILWVDLGCDEG